MAFSGLLVSEIFHSIQGESSLAGLPFVFIRLSGCNLRCIYCDSPYAFKGGEKLSIEALLEKIRPYKTKSVLLTGGEPLLQRQTPTLIHALHNANYTISIETHGEVSLAPLAPHPYVRIIMDIKTPGSGMCRGGFEKNLKFLKPTDEIKFVLTSPEDYSWAKKLVTSGRLPTREILFSPVTTQEPSPTSAPSPQWLAKQILEDHLPVRLQIQLHKILWGPDCKGC